MKRPKSLCITSDLLSLHPTHTLGRYRKPYCDNANIKLTDLKRTILDDMTDRLTVKPTSQRFVFNIFCQTTNFLNQFFANTQNTLSFFSITRTQHRKKMKECFLQPFAITTTICYL